MSHEIVEVYADWQPIEAPLLIGQLTYSDSSRGGVFSFAYDKAFLTSAYRLQIDPILTLHSGELYNDEANKNFRSFLDSSPDKWGRIVFNIAVSNTDDHLRNHGFLLTKNGWKLSPAYDLNPILGKHGLHLNITDADNALDYQLAFDVKDFFRLSQTQATQIYDVVLMAVKQWQTVAKRLGISRAEQAMKESAFNV